MEEGGKCFVYLYILKQQKNSIRLFFFFISKFPQRYYKNCIFLYLKSLPNDYKK